MFKLLRDFAVEDFFSYESHNARKEEKSSTDELPTTRFAVDYFLSYKLLESRKRRIFLPASYMRASTGNQGSRWVRQGWSIATRRDVKKERRKRPRKVVCRHKKGTWEKLEKKRKRPRKVFCCHKKGTWEKEEKKRKRPCKAIRWLQRRQSSVCPTPRISFFGSRVFGLGSGPSR